MLVPYNVTITEVGDPSQANIIIDIGDNSACGSAADGVLGCFNAPNAEITMLLGWNWYAGADPAQIEANQYDFETTVLHELGHALGLGGSTDPGSPMFETLAAGVADRIPSAQDLNIPDPPEGADPQMAAGFSPGSATMPSSPNPRAAAPVAVAVPGLAGLMPLLPASDRWSAASGHWLTSGGASGPQVGPEPGLVVQGLDHENGRELSLTGPDTGRVLDSVLSDLIMDTDRPQGERTGGTSGIQGRPEAEEVGDATGPEPTPTDRNDPTDFVRPVGVPIAARPIARDLVQPGLISDAVLDDLAAVAAGWSGRATIPGGRRTRPSMLPEPDGGPTRLATTLIVAGSWIYLARSRGTTRRAVVRPGPG